MCQMTDVASSQQSRTAAGGPDVVCRPRLRQLKRISELLAWDEGKELVV